MLDFITYKGEKYPVRFNWSTKKYLSSIKDLDVFQQAELALFCGLKSGHKAEDKEMPFKMEDMEFLLDECYDEFDAAFKKQLKADQPDQDSDKKKS
jgi:hypothetical protein